MHLVIGFIITAIAYALCLWLATIVAKVQASFPTLIIISALTSIASMVPTIGLILAIVVLFVGLVKWTSAEFWPDAVLVAVIANLIVKVGSFAIENM